jgi:hypothetical protein
MEYDPGALKPLRRSGEKPGYRIATACLLLLWAGKANQYYLRGFQLDHGTDLASTIAGMPINLPTHAHGQGRSKHLRLTYKKEQFYQSRL